jgi:hypothetical protein
MKEFLKPSWINVSLTVIINAILWFLPIIPKEIPVECMGCGTETFYYSVYEYLFDFVIRNEIHVLICLAIVVFVIYLFSSYIANRYNQKY